MTGCASLRIYQAVDAFELFTGLEAAVGAIGDCVLGRR